MEKRKVVEKLIRVEESIEEYVGQGSVLIFSNSLRREYLVHNINVFKRYIMDSIRMNRGVVDRVTDSEIRYHYSVYDCLTEAGNDVQCVNKAYIVSYRFKPF